MGFAKTFLSRKGFAMRGLELPINMIVVIAIAVLALTVIAAFFTGSIGGGINSITVEQAWNRACTNLKSVQDCSNTNFKISGYALAAGGKGIVESQSGPGIDFLTVCGLKGITTTPETNCIKACGCPI